MDFLPLGTPAIRLPWTSFWGLPTLVKPSCLGLPPPGLPLLKLNTPFNNCGLPPSIGTASTYLGSLPMQSRVWDSGPPHQGPSCNSNKGQIIGTGGRISVDRSSKATLPLTIPRPIFKSSAKDSSPRSSGIAMQSTRARLLPPARGSSRHMLLGAHRRSY